MPKTLYLYTPVMAWLHTDFRLLVSCVCIRMIGIGTKDMIHFGLDICRCCIVTWTSTIHIFGGGRNRSVSPPNSAPLHTSGDDSAPVLSRRTLGEQGSDWPLLVRRR